MKALTNMGTSLRQIKRDLKAMHMKAYRDGICQELSDIQCEKRVECALKMSKLIIKWSNDFGREMRFRLLFQSDEKIFTYNWS